MTLETSPMNTIYYISNKIMITTIIITTMEIIYIHIYAVCFDFPIDNWTLTQSSMMTCHVHNSLPSEGQVKMTWYMLVPRPELTWSRRHMALVPSSATLARAVSSCCFMFGCFMGIQPHLRWTEIGCSFTSTLLTVQLLWKGRWLREVFWHVLLHSKVSN